MKYEEIGKIEIVDSNYLDEVCDVLEANGFQTALIHDGIGPVQVRILKER